MKNRRMHVTFMLKREYKKDDVNVAVNESERAVGYGQHPTVWTNDIISKYVHYDTG